MATPRTIEQYRNLGTPWQTHLFRVDFTTVPAGLNGFLIGAGSDPNTVSLKVMSAGWPDKTIEEIEADYGRGVKVRYVGITTFEPEWQVGFKETQDLGLVRFINAWMDLCHDPRTGVGADKTAYEGEATVTLIGPNNQDLKQRRFIGLWPKNMGEVSLDFSSSDVAQVDVSWCYDYWIDVS